MELILFVAVCVVFTIWLNLSERERTRHLSKELRDRERDEQELESKIW